MKYDLIIVSASRDASLRKMTQDAIDSCLADGADVNVIMVETFKIANYRNVNKTVLFTGEFNYNHCLTWAWRTAKVTYRYCRIMMLFFNRDGHR